MTSSTPAPANPADVPTKAPELTSLAPKRLRFEKKGSILHYWIDGQEEGTGSIFRAFPLAHPNRYWSLRNKDNEELGIIENPDALDAQSLAAAREEVERRYVMPEIKRIVSVKGRFRAAVFEAETSMGLRTFRTQNMREGVWYPSPGRMILKDIDGFRFDIPNLAALDPKSRSRLMQHM